MVLPKSSLYGNKAFGWERGLSSSQEEPLMVRRHAPFLEANFLDGQGLPWGFLVPKKIWMGKAFGLAPICGSKTFGVGKAFPGASWSQVKPLCDLWLCSRFPIWKQDFWVGKGFLVP